MIDRRALFGGVACLSARTAFARDRAPPRPGQDDSFPDYLLRVREQARREGVGSALLDVALALPGPNARVLALDQHQPEFVMTWPQYRSRVLSAQKIRAGRAAWRERAALLGSIWRRYRVDPRILVGIWGLESDYGIREGGFGVVDALATLAYHGRRSAFFDAELLSALLILQQGDIAPAGMLGSYAGAMGQAQFMPSSYLRYAVDFDGDGRRDIWSSVPDVLASIANYLAKCGWVAGAPWGQPVLVPNGLGLGQTGRGVRRSLGSWMRLGVRRADGTRFSRSEVAGAILRPAGVNGPAFMVYGNFDVIRRYNASDFYGLAVGQLAAALA